jgi:hypothetical protein
LAKSGDTIRKCVGVQLPRYPIIGFAGCCARTASGFRCQTAGLRVY